MNETCQILTSFQTLDKFVKVELLEKETPEKIAEIWNAGHANKDCITAVIPSDIYDKLYKRSQEYPMVYQRILYLYQLSLYFVIVYCSYAS